VLLSRTKWCAARTQRQRSAAAQSAATFVKDEQRPGAGVAALDVGARFDERPGRGALRGCLRVVVAVVATAAAAAATAGAKAHPHQRAGLRQRRRLARVRDRNKWARL
jgi:hypothetical protein